MLKLDHHVYSIKHTPPTSMIIVLVFSKSNVGCDTFLTQKLSSLLAFVWALELYLQQWLVLLLIGWNLLSHFLVNSINLSQIIGCGHYYSVEFVPMTNLRTQHLSVWFFDYHYPWNFLRPLAESWSLSEAWIVYIDYKLIFHSKLHKANHPECISGINLMMNEWQKKTWKRL